MEDIMYAAVVTSFDEPPHYQEVETPAPTSPDEELADVLAVGLHPRVRSGASGAHYTSTGRLPLIPGIDGVARLADGQVVYFVADDDLPGPMAGKTVIDRRRTVPLPDGTDVAKVAAAMNPAMSSWVALRRRITMREGAGVLILGASGNAGAMAVQVARHLGAGQVVAAGRGDLSHLDADLCLPLDALDKAADVDLVLDYLWGKPAQEAMPTLIKARSDRSKALDWIQIGAVAGPTIELPSVVLRAANFRILGNGQGAVSTRGYLAELPALIETLPAFTMGVRTVALRDVEATWRRPDTRGERVVLIP
jgi:NADPH:quinone reductase-like Zn-dependent oxidoreductase